MQQQRKSNCCKTTSRAAAKAQQRATVLNLTLPYAQRDAWHKYHVPLPLAKTLLKELQEWIEEWRPEGDGEKFYMSSRLTADRCSRCEYKRVFAPSCAADEQCLGHSLNNLDPRKIRIIARETTVGKKEKEGKRVYRVLFSYGYADTPFIYDVNTAEVYYHATFPCTCFDCPNTVYKGYRTESGKKATYTRCKLQHFQFSTELVNELQIFCDSLQLSKRKEEEAEE